MPSLLKDDIHVFALVLRRVHSAGPPALTLLTRVAIDFETTDSEMNEVLSQSSSDWSWKEVE